MYDTFIHVDNYERGEKKLLRNRQNTILKTFSQSVFYRLGRKKGKRKKQLVFTLLLTRARL